MKNWKIFLRQPQSRLYLLVSTCISISILVGFFFFLSYNELRPGYHFLDPVLRFIPPQDFSVPIFSITYLLAAIGVLWSFQRPDRLLYALSAYALMTLVRMCSLWLLPLNAPEGIIPLSDPFLQHSFYNGRLNLKDLFFSGHTATLFLFYFLMRETKLRLLFLVGGIVVACLLCAQHVHYSIDVFAAPVVAWIVVKGVRRFFSSDQ